MKLILPVMALAVAMFLIWTMMAPVAVVTGGEATSDPPAAESAAQAVGLPAPPDTLTGNDFVGVARCKMCHQSEASGDQYGIWKGSQHAQAYTTLGTDKAKAIGAKRNIADPQTSHECLICHITAYPVLDTISEQKITLEEGVSCESCHGPGSGYWKMSTMKALTAGEIEPATVGLVVPKEDFCRRCHNEASPTFTSFSFAEFWPKIAHPIPHEGQQ